MSRRKQLVEKIIREELVGYMKKFLGEGMRTPVQTMPAKKPDRARNPRQMASSTMTSIVDPPDLEHHFVEEEISGQLAEEADEADSENYGVDTTAPITPGEDDTGKIKHVPEYPLESDEPVLAESQIRRWKQLALIEVAAVGPTPVQLAGMAPEEAEQAAEPPVEAEGPTEVPPPEAEAPTEEPEFDVEQELKKLQDVTQDVMPEVPALESAFPEAETLDDLGEPLEAVRGQRRPASAVEPLEPAHRDDQIKLRIGEASILQRWQQLALIKELDIPDELKFDTEDFGEFDATATSPEGAPETTVHGTASVPGMEGAAEISAPAGEVALPPEAAPDLDIGGWTPGEGASPEDIEAIVGTPGAAGEVEEPDLEAALEGVPGMTPEISAMLDDPELGAPPPGWAGIEEAIRRVLRKKLLT